MAKSKPAATKDSWKKSVDKHKVSNKLFHFSWSKNDKFSNKNDWKKKKKK